MQPWGEPQGACSVTLEASEIFLCPEQLAAASKDKVDCMTNLALVAQKQRNFTECFKWCDKALR